MTQGGEKKQSIDAQRKGKTTVKGKKKGKKFETWDGESDRHSSGLLEKKKKGKPA